ncbi:MAG TPA: 5'/3'-nucleotidase SurE [Herpetosiphonaceae bacterium]
MYILVTNDDGIQSPGLLALRQALDTIGETVVVAPERNWSAASAARTLFDPLRVDPVSLADGREGFVCTGTPGDCVALSLLGILKRRPDLVVSGINIGPNLGNDVSYSGTVAAAREGTIMGIPSIAVSLDGHRDADFRPAAAFAARLARLAVEHDLSPEVVLNVNVPHSPIRGVAITRLGRRVYRDELVVRHDPRGRPYYWLGGGEPEGDLTEGTDTAAVANGYISVTPVHFDLTNQRWLDTLRRWPLDV